MTSVRLLTYNILGGKAKVALRSVVHSVEPDVMVVNETPQTPLLWRWQHHIGVAETYVERTRQPLLQPIRGLVSAQLQAGSHRFGVVGVHLGLDPKLREAQVQQVLAAAERLHGPVVVAGDLNEPPKGPSWDALRAAGFADHGDAEHQTYPAEHPAKRIDAILVRGDVDVSRHRIPGLQPELLRLASDHLPVTVTLSWH